MIGGAAGADSSFGDGLAAAGRLIIADARRALVDPELSEAEAVHEVRKALKRWRALLRLLARPLGELRTVVAHLGSGCSVTAVDGGRFALDAGSVLASNGFTHDEMVFHLERAS